MPLKGVLVATGLVKLLKRHKRSLRKFLARVMPNPNEVGNIYATPNGLFAIPSNDLMIAGVLRKGESWGADEVRRMEAVVPVDSAILFVGGHVGTLAVPAARRAGDVTVIEANPNTFRFLLANIQLNQLENVTAIQTAAGEDAGTIEFVAMSDNTGGSKRKPLVADPRYYYDDPDMISVDMVRLDSILEPRFDAIIMDVEGSEYYALKGMPRILERATALFVEFLPHHLDNVAGVTVEQFLEAIGPGFDHMFVPSQRQAVSGAAVLDKLKEIYAGGIGEDVLLFSRHPLPPGLI